MARISSTFTAVLLAIAGQVGKVEPVRAAGTDCDVTLTDEGNGTATLAAILLPGAPLASHYTFASRIAQGSNVSVSSQSGKIPSDNIPVENGTSLGRLRIATVSHPTIQATLKVYGLNGDLICEGHFNQ